VAYDGQTDISIEELLYWGEFCAWCALVLVPLLWWFNGPSVSTDQFYVRSRSGLLVISAVTAIGLRLGKWWVRASRNGRIKRPGEVVMATPRPECAASDPILSVIVPIYNERDKLLRSLDHLVTAMPLLELILVDDASTDGSTDLVRALELPVRVTTRFHVTNRGKGAAIRTAIPLAHGRYVVMHDTDLEYDPQDLPRLIGHLEETHAEAVYGNRFHDHARRCLWHTSGNQLISWMFSLVSGVRVSDVETCYKLIRREYRRQIELDVRESRFGIEIELTARLAAIGVRFAELPIRYQRRGYQQGKKIGWRDGVSARRARRRTSRQAASPVRVDA
jgi:GT2 family glycosyltransferase